MFDWLKRPSNARLEGKNIGYQEMIAWHGMGAAQWGARDGASLAVSGYRQNVIAYRCVQMIADAAASVKLHLQDGRVTVNDHPVQAILGQPNPDQTGQALLEAVYGHLQIHGNAYLEMVALDDVVKALYLLRPDRVRVETDRQGWPTSYIYKTGGKSRVLQRRPDGVLPVIHLKLFNPVNDQYGQSPMQVAANAIDLHNSALAWNKSLIDNAARPSGALIYRGVDGASNLTAEQFTRLKEELQDTYQGSQNTGRPMVLDGGLDWRPMSLSPTEMDFIQLKNSAARDIALAFGVPPMLLGIPGDNTYSNYQQAVLAFWRQTVLPLVNKVATALSTQLAVGPLEIICNTEHIDSLAEAQSGRLNAILDAEFLTIAEKRVALGFPASPQGEMV